jgi:hypothetical protein
MFAFGAFAIVVSLNIFHIIVGRFFGMIIHAGVNAAIFGRGLKTTEEVG